MLQYFSKGKPLKLNKKQDHKKTLTQCQNNAQQNHHNTPNSSTKNATQTYTTRGRKRK
jgi:hypothetical protein